MLGSTESLCPICLKRIPAERIADGDDVYLEKRCAEHGSFRTIIWRGVSSYQSWGQPAGDGLAKRPSPPSRCPTPVDKGCPFDCGLCSEHHQPSCCVVLEVTKRCNLRCSVCFAEAGAATEDPAMRTIESWFKRLLASGGPCNIQLSGGEPTLRDDLPEIITLGRALGFSYFQLNTNGLRIARDPAYLRRLKEAGLSCVFLQFDGTNDAIHRAIRGADLLEVKTKAISNCAELHLGVVLVPTLIPGVNTEDIGGILDYALARVPAVRGVHFQPISYFGRYPTPPRDADRITIPEVINKIEQQTGGRVKAAELRPPAAENAYCSFHGNFTMTPDGVLKSAADAAQSGCCGTAAAPKPLVQIGCCGGETAAESTRKAQQYVALRWTLPNTGDDGKSMESTASRDDSAVMKIDSLNAFLEQSSKRSFCVSGMAFQDVWNVDLERLRDCFIHVVGEDKGIVPFCAYNMTNMRGDSLYRGK
jgi:7,8-dihydro-6-hydroxymethylpterin dimethyltransferase